MYNIFSSQFVHSLCNLEIPTTKKIKAIVHFGFLWFVSMMMEN